jgi:hypothetical protein
MRTIVDKFMIKYPFFIYSITYIYFAFRKGIYFLHYFWLLRLHSPLGKHFFPCFKLQTFFHHNLRTYGMLFRLSFSLFYHSHLLSQQFYHITTDHQIHQPCPVIIFYRYQNHPHHVITSVSPFSLSC